MANSLEQSFEEILKGVEQRVLEQASRSLKRLEDEGCDRLVLLRFLASLEIIADQPLTRTQWTGFDRKGFFAAVANIRHCSGLLKRLYSHPLGGNVITHNLPLQDRFSVVRLPEILVMIADGVEAQAENRPPGRLALRKNCLVALTTYVHGATGRYFDGQLAALITAATGSDYSADALKMLRRGNRYLVSEFVEAHHRGR